MAGLRRKRAKNSIRCKKLAFLLEKSSWLIRAGANLRHCSASVASVASGDYLQKQCTSQTMQMTSRLLLHLGPVQDSGEEVQFGLISPIDA